MARAWRAPSAVRPRRCSVMRVGIAALMLAAGQAAATPPDVCGLLGEATGWSIIAADSVTLREGTGYHEQSEVEGPICSRTASRQNVWVRGQFVPGGIPGDVVALAAAGRAIQLRPSPQSCLYC